MRLLFLAAGFGLAAASTGLAQDSAGPGDAGSHDRRGVWFSAGAGFGSRGLSCTSCIGAGREQGFSISLRVGGTAGSHATVGANLLGWIKSDNDGSGRRITVFSALMGVGQLYPVRRSGFFLQGGVGYIVDVVDDDLVLEGVGVIVGAGIDLRVGRAFSITPLVNYVRTVDAGAISSSLFQLGVAATWH